MSFYFPVSDCHARHHRRDYSLVLFSLVYITCAVNYDGSGSLAAQKVLAIMTWSALIVMLWDENKETRMQVILTLTFATLAEHFASIYMGCYRYRFNNVPLYVPPGHGVIYLAIIALARSGFFLHYARKITLVVLVAGGSWVLWGVFFAAREDLTGAVLFILFLIYVFKGRAPMIYLAAFFVSTWLEIVGTFSGTWAWAEIDPIFGLTQANPPSGVAACYCFVDSLAIINTKLGLKAWNFMLKKIEMIKIPLTSRQTQWVSKCRCFVKKMRNNV
ncbi:MAG: hypothetical protein Q9M50_00170 [Methylococcales bacterium]|nr:hypothetical protein [Methylococcales bacterium]